MFGPLSQILSLNKSQWIVPNNSLLSTCPFYIYLCYFYIMSYILFSIFSLPMPVDNNFMDDKEIGYTNHFIHYNNVLSQRHSHQHYRPRTISRQSTPKTQTVLPLKRFQQYFGKVKPSLYQQLRNIFLNSTIQQKTVSDLPQSPRCVIQGTTLTSRAYQIRKKAKKEPNHFTKQSFNGKQLYRKAKLNHLIKLKQCLKEDNQTVQLCSLVQESMQFVKQLRESSGINKKRFTATAVTFRQGRSLTTKNTLIEKINPNNSKQRITVNDYHLAITLLHRVKVHVPPSLSYFNVYIQEGNNSELLKMLVRRRNGWRVVQLPNNANLIWTQFYKKSVLNKRLHKREKTQRQDQLPRTSKSLPYRIAKMQKDSCSSPTKQNQDYFVNSLRKLIPLKEAQNLSELQIQCEDSFKVIAASQNILVHNHFPQNRCISDKKNLLINMRSHYSKNTRNLFEIIPQSYQLYSLDLNHQLLNKIAQSQEEFYWIIKPGENSNRGRGITVVKNGTPTLQQLKKRIGENQQEKGKCVILQRYITPLLYNKRKFDIRSYMLVTLLNGQLRLYSYEECYIRTSSKTFDITSQSRLVHLTNDAIQAQSSCYGRHQEGNKLSQQLFQKYIDQQYRRTGQEQSIWKHLRAEMQQRYIDVLQSSWQKLIRGCHYKSEQTDPSIYFEVFGIDFMIDNEFKLWLIEVNTNPAITHDCSKVLNQLIPAMLDNLLIMAVEPWMPPLKPNNSAFDNKFKAIHKIDIH